MGHCCLSERPTGSEYDSGNSHRPLVVVVGDVSGDDEEEGVLGVGEALGDGNQGFVRILLRQRGSVLYVVSAAAARSSVSPPYWL